MDTDEAWESFIGIRKSNKGYADTIAAALNDIKTDTANLAKLTNQLLGDQQLLENSPGESPAADLGGAPTAMPGSDEMPQDAADNVNALDDAMSVIDEQVGGGQPPAGGAGEAPAEGAEAAPEEGVPAMEDETAMEAEPAPEAPMPDGGMEPEGMVPQPEASFDTECVQFMDLAKKELQNVTGAGDYYKARRLIGIITDIEKILNSDDDPDTLLKGQDEQDNGEVVPEGGEDLAASREAAPMDDSTFAKSEGATASAMPQTDRGSSEGGRKRMPMPDVDMEKAKHDVVGSSGMTDEDDFAESEDAEPIAESEEAETEDIAESEDAETIAESEDAEPIAESCGSEPVKKTAMPDALPSFKDMLAHRKGAEGEDVYISFMKSATDALQHEVDEHFETMGFTKSTDDADIAKSIDPETGEDAIPPEARRTPVGRDIAVLQNKEGDLYNTRHARTAVTDRDLVDEDGDEYYDEFADDQLLTPEQSKKAVDVLSASKDPATRAISQRVGGLGKFGVQRLSTDEDTGYAELYKSAALPESLPSFKSMMAHKRGSEEDPYVSFSKSVMDAFEDFRKSDESAAADEPSVSIAKRSHKLSPEEKRKSRWTPEQKAEKKESQAQPDGGDDYGTREKDEVPEVSTSHEDVAARKKKGLSSGVKEDDPSAGLKAPDRTKDTGFKVSPEQRRQDDREHEEFGGRDDHAIRVNHHLAQKPVDADSNVTYNQDLTHNDDGSTASYGKIDPDDINEAARRAGVKPVLTPSPEAAQAVGSTRTPLGRAQGSPASSEDSAVGSKAQDTSTEIRTTRPEGDGATASDAAGKKTRSKNESAAEKPSSTSAGRGRASRKKDSSSGAKDYGTPEERAQARDAEEKRLDAEADAADTEAAKQLAEISKFVRKKLNLPPDDVLNEEQQRRFDKEFDQILKDHAKAGRLYDPQLVERLRNQKFVDYDMFGEGGADSTSPRGSSKNIHPVDDQAVKLVPPKDRAALGEMPATVNIKDLRSKGYIPESEMTEDQRQGLETQQQATEDDRRARGEKKIMDDYEKQQRKLSPKRPQDDGERPYVALKDFLDDYKANEGDPDYRQKAIKAFMNSHLYEKMDIDGIRALEPELEHDDYVTMFRPIGKEYYAKQKEIKEAEEAKRKKRAEESAAQPPEQPAEQPVKQPEQPAAQTSAQPNYPAYQKRATPAPYNTFDRFIYDFNRYGGDPDYARKAVKGLMASSFYPQLTRDRVDRLPEEAKKIIAEREEAKRNARTSVSESAGSVMMKSASPLVPFSDLMAKYRRLRA